ncbi:hypothetical protein GGI42DRAFT_18651 [Trichoderma sp. SZMC 28013]
MTCATPTPPCQVHLHRQEYKEGEKKRGSNWEKQDAEQGTTAIHNLQVLRYPPQASLNPFTEHVQIQTRSTQQLQRQKLFFAIILRLGGGGPLLHIGIFFFATLRTDRPVWAPPLPLPLVSRECLPELDFFFSAFVLVTLQRWVSETRRFPVVGGARGGISG